MKKIFIIVLISISHFMVKGQANDSLEKSKRAISIYFTPEYSYRKLKTENDNDAVLNYRDSVEIPKFSYTAGINILFKLKNNFSLETGVLFSDKGQKTRKILLGNSLSQTELPIYSSITNHFYYLGLPLKVNYYLINRNFKLFITGGAIANLLINQKTTILLEYTEKQSEKSNSKFTNGYEKLNVAMFVGLGIQQRLDKKTFFVFSPIFTRSLQSVSSEPIKSYFYSIGATFALNFMF